MRSVPARLAARLLLSVLAPLMAPATAISQEVASAVPQSQDIADRIRALLAAEGTSGISAPDFDTNGLRTFYDARQYQPAWIGSPAAQANANLVLAALEHADDEGLRSDRYRLGEIDLGRKAQGAEAAAEFEILLTDSLLRYARDLRQGQAELRDLDQDVGLPPDYFYPATDLTEALKANRLGDFLASLPPPHPEYQHLKVALARYRAIAAKDGSSAADEHVQRIIANMERWRWVPRSFGSRYVNVNTASASLEVMENGNVVLTSSTVVGKPDSRTPIFTAVATAFTVNPSWHIPTQIVRKEILPHLRANPGYLSRHHMVRTSTGGYRQLPGHGNALGVIKMEMPNEFDAYLHDTPMHSLFAEDERHLSHGCVRVERIQPLISYAMTGDVDSGMDRIHSLIMTHATRRISLDDPLPVFVLYWTAIADADGAVNFLPDVYGRDQRLIAASAEQHLSSRITMNFGTPNRN
jgi:murein L,D-transpeptidase YcbB/YkuD